MGWNEINNELNFGRVANLPREEQVQLEELVDVFRRHNSGNRLKNRYYEGRVTLREVNLGIALPHGFRGLEIGCAWGAKCVDVLAARSMFDGFVSARGEPSEELERIVTANRLVSEYAKACRDQLKYGCTFSTLSRDAAAGCKIRFHSPQTAAASWDGERGRIACGFAIVSTVKDGGRRLPSVCNLYTDNAIWVLRRKGSTWSAQCFPHRMSRPLMEPLVWNATSNKPFGRSRIKEPVRRLIQGYVRTVANATIGLEFSTAPQKYLLGVTDDQYDAIVNQKFKQYIGSILASTINPETGEVPKFGQLAQGNISPHIEMLRLLSTQFSAATGLSVTDVGVVNDANPTSSDAITAQTKTLVGLAEQLNAANGESLRTIALMATAVANNTTMDRLTEDQKSVVAHFKNPSMPSVAATTDAAIKLASARQGFAQTDVFLEMVGFAPADIRRIKAQETRARGMELLEELGATDTGNDDTGS